MVGITTDGQLQPALGNYAAGDRFWDRTREVGDISAYLADGQSVLVTGPRRVGKPASSAECWRGSIRRSARCSSTWNTTTFIDVEHHDDPAEMFAALAAAASGDAGFWRRIGAWFGKRLGAAADRVDTVDLGVLKVELQAA